MVSLAGVIGLVLGLTLAFLRNSMRPGIKDPGDIERHTGLNVFSTIPVSKPQRLLAQKIKNKAQGHHVLAVLHPQDPATESLRSLRTALQFAMLDTASNIVLLTGPTPGIGKTFTSVNFAAVLAAAGKKVLLIDADLRKGHMNQYFGLSRGIGLSELASGSAAWQEVIHKEILTNVDFVTTGTLPPNPAEVLMTLVARNVLSQVASNYDMVVIDTAPVLVASDTSILAPAAGAVFLVARSEVTSLAELVESAKRLRQSGTVSKGVVFNGLDMSNQRYGYGAGSKHGKYRYTNYNY